MSKNNKTQGSAILLVLGAISVLGILVFSMVRTNTNRSFSTRFMSDEQKAEAVAESAADLMLGYIKNQMNLENSEIYQYLRLPTPIEGGKIWSSDGRNYQLDVSKIQDFLDDIEYGPAHPDFGSLKALVENIGEENVDVKVKVRIAQAEAFTSDIDDYEVSGVSTEVKKARGKSAQFLDSIDQPIESDGPLNSASWAPSEWKADFNLPNKTKTDVKTFEVKVSTKIFGFNVSIKVTVELKIEWIKAAVAKATVSVKSPITLNNVGSIVLNFNTIIKDNFIDLDDEDLSIKGIRKLIMDEPGNNSDDAVLNISYKANRLKNAIDNEYNDYKGSLKAPYRELYKPDNFSSTDLRVVEKGGLLEVITEVDYYPHSKDNDRKISKKLVSNIPFKVTDVQPVAPEYSFFVAASDKLSEGVSSMSGSKILIESTNVGTFSVHNLPEAKYQALTGLNYGSKDDLQVPGMLRMNSNSKLYINTFIGTPSEPWLTELNIMTSPEVDITKTFMNVPVFQWKGDTVERFHELNFPVLFYSDPDWKPYLPPGLKAIGSFFSEGGLTSLESATLLLGNCHMEYPLGIVIESPLVMRYANVSIEADPYAEVDFDELCNDPPEGFDMDQFEEDIENDNLDDYDDLFADNLDGDSGAVDELSKVYINYENREMPYGMLDYPAYDSLSEYKPDVPANFPPNCYSLIQYAKKATYFYDSFGQFLSQHSRHPDDNTAYYLNGVVYIKDGIEVETDNPLRLKGKGILVCKKDIKLHADVVRVGEDSVVSLISRGGAIYFEDGCKSVQAACFSNLAPVTTTSNIVRIYGNLVTNEFNRDQITELEIFYDSKSCRTSPLSVIRDVGKFAPSRYWVSMPDNWASFKYEKFEEN